MATSIFPWLKPALNLIFPRNCRLCSLALAESDPGAVCPACLAKAPWIVEPFCWRCALPFDGKLPDPFICGHCGKLKFAFTRIVAACRAEGVVRDCIHRVKYNHETYIIPHLAAWLIAAARREIDFAAVDSIVPVPLHPVRYRHRGFNQAEELATALGVAVGKPVWSQVVRRIKDTPTQTHLHADQRRANLKGAFAACRKPEASVTGQRLVVVDDVFTTGATLDACASLLIESGAQSVIAVTVARGV